MITWIRFPRRQQEHTQLVGEEENCLGCSMLLEQQRVKRSSQHTWNGGWAKVAACMHTLFSPQYRPSAAVVGSIFLAYVCLLLYLLPLIFLTPYLIKSWQLKLEIITLTIKIIYKLITLLHKFILRLISWHCYSFILYFILSQVGFLSGANYYTLLLYKEQNLEKEDREHLLTTFVTCALVISVIMFAMD
jgi:hypothetical protein